MTSAGDLIIAPCDPLSEPARAMADALWEEIQQRYGFSAPNPMDLAAFTGPRGGFWVATDGDEPVGSIALSPLEGTEAELDVMYVAPAHRRRGVAHALLAVLEERAVAIGVSVLRLRAGDPQPEALAFYAACGFTPAPPFGVWVGDETARCLEKALSRPR